MHAFLSYSRQDEPTVRALYRTLKDAGVNVWLDVESLHAGQDWATEIRSAIARASLFLACLSRSSVNRQGYIQVELNQALDIFKNVPEGDVFIIPIRLEECELPPALQRLHWVDFFTADGPRRVLSSIGHCIPVQTPGKDAGSSGAYRLQPGEWAVLMAMKGKPDVSWNASLIELAVRRSYPADAAGIPGHVQSLVAKGYIRGGADGRILPTGVTIDFWKRQRQFSRERLEFP